MHCITMLRDMMWWGLAVRTLHRAIAVGMGPMVSLPLDSSADFISCYYASSVDSLPDPPAPTGCFAGTRGPPPGTILAVGEKITWAAAADFELAYDPDFGDATVSRIAVGGSYASFEGALVCATDNTKTWRGTHAGRHLEEGMTKACDVDV